MSRMVTLALLARKVEALNTLADEAARAFAAAPALAAELARQASVPEVRALVDLAPVGAFALAGYAALAVIEAPPQARVIALVIINANVIVRADPSAKSGPEHPPVASCSRFPRQVRPVPRAEARVPAV